MRRKLSHGFTLFPACVLAGLLLAATAPLASASDASKLQDYVGTWLLKSRTQNVLVLQLKFAEGKLSGTVVRPKEFHTGSGDLTGGGPELKQETITGASISDGHLQLSTGTSEDDDRFSLTFADNDHAEIDRVENVEKVVATFPLGTLQRAKPSDDIAIATNWPQRGPKSPSKEITDLQSELKQMVELDQAVRVKSPVSWEEIQRADDKHYPEIVRIFEHYGWPRISVVGEDAAHNYWLLVQHSKEEFQDKVLPELKRALDDGEAWKTDYAYLYDRVMVRAGKPQHWGTQGGACKDGKTTIDPVDDPAGLAQRRKELHLMPIDQYAAILSDMCAQFEGPPATKPAQK